MLRQKKDSKGVKKKDWVAARTNVALSTVHPYLAACFPRCHAPSISVGQ